MRVIFAGSPAPARRTLELLFEKQAEYGFELAGVFSNPDSAQGRHKTPVPTPVSEFARENGLPLFTPEHLDAAVRSQLEPLQPDLLVCFAYGHIFGPKFLGLFKMGGINLHPSLLPLYRGCTPVPAAILNRDKRTAATIQTLSVRMDEGNILAQRVIELDGTETSGSLLDWSAQAGAELILGLIKAASQNGSLPEGTAQTGPASYTGIITKESARINWKDCAAVTEAKIRAYNPEPVCWCLENEQPLRLFKAEFIEENDEVCKNYTGAFPGTVVAFDKGRGILVQTGGGLLCVKELQRQGKKIMNYKDFMNGARDFVGTVLK